MKKMVYTIAIILVFALGLFRFNNKTLSSVLKGNKEMSQTLICKNKEYSQHQAIPVEQILFKKLIRQDSPISDLANQIFYKKNSTSFFVFRSTVIYLANNQSPG